MEYITRQRDVLDDIVSRQYGNGAWSVVQAVLAANPGLADNGPVLPAGITIVLPVISTPSTEVKAVSLWD